MKIPSLVLLACAALGLAAAKAAVAPAAPTHRLVLVEAGSFLMGREGGPRGEGPVHEVRLSRPFLVAAREVTYAEYGRYVAASGKRGPKHRGEGARPVMGVNWYEAVAYCNWLSAREGLEPCYAGAGRLTDCDFGKNGYRLPTEAEWEYAARGGHLAAVNRDAAGEAGATGAARGRLFAGSASADEVAWYESNSGGVTHEVGSKAPNELGLHDMSGNMYEWCWDWFRDDYYASSPALDPTGPAAPETIQPWTHEKARRSGCWREAADSVTVASRSQDYASYEG
ncbi:MAG: SUMF1/EgtB/PvdO family nonheme iron enzyme, partial [Spirochaetaceae bacterium]|nr:SUMF1/EgtB/PvdO family nonheme iron enzyme [Spirochaetaceae bacterium]